tara:strand:+ start:21 stop:329 length:309 start_codon:yes stop_codon:yes gene_type:complete
MTRFETLQGESLGVTFWGGKTLGKVRFMSKTEMRLIWSLDESDKVVSDNGWIGSVGELLDLFSELTKCPEKVMIRKGWGDRLESGLSLQTCVSDEGELFLTR